MYRLTGEGVDTSTSRDLVVTQTRAYCRKKESGLVATSPVSALMCTSGFSACTRSTDASARYRCKREKRETREKKEKEEGEKGEKGKER